MKNCTFDGGGSSNGIASVHVASNTNNVRNIVVDSCTVSNAHSLIQIQGGTNGLVVTNCKGINDVHNGINITGGSSSFIIMNDTLNVDGYGVFGRITVDVGVFDAGDVAAGAGEMILRHLRIDDIVSRLGFIGVTEGTEVLGGGGGCGGLGLERVGGGAVGHGLCGGLHLG